MRERLFSIIIMLLLLNGCTDERIVSLPISAEDYSITFIDLPDSIKSFEGVEWEIPLIVQVNTESGAVVPGVEVNFSVLSGDGEITARNAVTDDIGTVQAVFISIMKPGFNTANINAEALGFASTATIVLQGMTLPRSVILSPEYYRILTLPDQDGIIEIVATVTDSFGVGIPGIDLIASVEALGEDSEAFGFVTDPSPTDSSGLSRLTFHSMGGFGSIVIRCRIDTDESLTDVYGKVELQVDQLVSKVQELRLTANPSFLEPSVDSIAFSTLRVSARDEEYVGLPGLPLVFSSNVGLVEHETITDSNGSAEVIFSSNHEYGTALVTATVPGTGIRTQTEIIIQNPVPEPFTLEIFTDRKMIFADDGRTTANITAVLKDANSHPVPGQSLQFSATHGAVASPQTTDESGIARTVLTDTGIPSRNESGQPDSAVVTVLHPQTGSSDSAGVMISPFGLVDMIYLTAGVNQLIAGSGDSTLISAKCNSSSRMPSPAGTVIRFYSRFGSFSISEVEITGDQGSAETMYHPGNQMTTDTLWAAFFSEGDTLVSNRLSIQLVSGIPDRIDILAEPDSLLAGDRDAQSAVTATVLDAYDNPVRPGMIVRFNTTLGMITSSAITDVNGDAVAWLMSGRTSGTAYVSASTGSQNELVSDTISVDFISAIPYSIELRADPMIIEIGHSSSSTLYATVRDWNDNLITEPRTVRFSMVNEPPPPRGCTIGDTGQVYLSQTRNGIAVASLNPGEQIGGKLIRAVTWPDSLNDPDRIIGVTLSGVMVITGPPFQVDLDVNSFGIDAGGGAWTVEVSARVWDIHRNPVSDRIPVVFTVEPEIANIDNGFTGNIGRNGESVQGLAFSNLIYLSSVTFRELEISAEVATERGLIIGSLDYTLPLQEGQLELSVNPANWMFEEERETAEIECRATLTDGHGIRINNAPILFTTTRARLWWRDTATGRLIEFFPDPAIKMSGIDDQHNSEPPGTSTVYLVAEEEDIFIAGDILETIVQVNARVNGLNVNADPQFVFFTRRE